MPLVPFKPKLVYFKQVLGRACFEVLKSAVVLVLGFIV